MPRATLAVRVQPRSRCNALAGLRDGVVIVRVTAPPLDGRANDAVCALLAAALGVRRSSLTILRGERARDKVISFDGLDQSTVEAAIATALRQPD